MKGISHMLKNILLWLQYNDDYIRIRKNPKANAYMQNDPGVKFMRRGWRIVFVIICILYIIGSMK